MDYVISEVKETNVDQSVKGISGQVTRTANSSIYYPNLCLMCEEKQPPKYKLNLLKNMRIGANTKQYENSGCVVAIYIKLPNMELLECGKYYQSQVVSILRLMQDECEIIGHTANRKELIGNYVYTMCM